MFSNSAGDKPPRYVGEESENWILHIPAAVHAQHLAGDVAGLIRNKEENRGGDVIRSSLEFVFSNRAGDKPPRYVGARPHDLFSHIPAAIDA